MMNVPALLRLVVGLWAAYWQPGPAVQQGAGECTGAAWAAYLATAPGPIRHFDGHILYQLGRVPGRDPALNLVGDVLLAHHVITAHAYTQDLATARRWIRTGPLLVAGRWPGTTWLHAATLYATDGRGHWRYQSSLYPYWGTFTDAQLAGLWFGSATKEP